MKHKLFIALMSGFLSITANCADVIDRDKWILINEGDTTFYLKSAINNISYDKPFEISVMTPFNKNLNPDISNPNTLFRSDYKIDCKNYFYDEISTTEFQVVGNKLKTNYVNDKLKALKPNERYKLRHSFAPDTVVAKDVCSLSPDYKETKFKNPIQSGWTLIVVKQKINYINNADLKYKSLTKPFLLRVKSYETVGSNSRITTGLIDCKNKRAVPIRTSYMSNDFEYGSTSQVKLESTTVHEKDIHNIPEKRWGDMGGDATRGLSSICQ